MSETAFIVGKNGRYGTRWFTPKVEVDLCGHATLASGWVVFNRIEPNLDSVSFATQEAGQLTVTRNGDQLSMDFPSRPPTPCAVPDGLIEALGREPIEILAARDCFCVFETEDDVRNLEPDMAALAEVDAWATIVTAPGRNSVDFVSRFFAPRQGIAEDPVTGSAHCTLTPYWAERLGKQTLEARQISARGGALKCSLHGDRVSIAGSVSLSGRSNKS